MDLLVLVHEYRGRVLHRSEQCDIIVKGAMLNKDGLQVRFHLLLDEQHPLGLVLTVQGIFGVHNRRQALVLVLLVGEVYDFGGLSIHQIVHHLDALNCLVAFKGQDEFLQSCLLKFRGHLLAIRKSKKSLLTSKSDWWCWASPWGPPGSATRSPPLPLRPSWTHQKQRNRPA